MVLDDQSRQYCDDCLPEYRNAQRAAFSDAGRMKLKALRATGTDPSQMGKAAEKRRTIITRRRREEADWDAAHPDHVVDESTFTAEILPQLQDVSLSHTSAVTGLSRQYCSLIRRGLKVPHPRHWENFKSVTVPSEHD